MVVFEPTDSVQLKKLFPQIIEHYGPVYIRLFRKNAWSIFGESDSFTLGNGCLLRHGSEVTLFASGIMVKEALEAAEQLAGQGISAEVINLHTIKPLDSELVLASVTKTGCCVTAENANIIGGLGSAVSECVSGGAPCPVLRVGVEDRFGEVGKMDYLQKELHLTAAKQLLLDSVGCRVVTAAGPTGKNQRIHNSLIVHLSLDSWLRCIRRKTPAVIRRNPRRTERLTLEKHSAAKEHR